jgi:hypothetical protein
MNHAVCRAALFAILTAAVAALLTTTNVMGQEPNGGAQVIAFRVDSTHAIATLKVIGEATQQITEGLSAEPAARFGFRYRDLPDEWRKDVAADIRTGERWLIHASPGVRIQADAERIVGGQLGCEDAAGVLLRIGPEQSEAFSALPAKYFLAERSSNAQSSQPPRGPAVRSVASPSDAEFRRGLESTLTELLARELPGVRAEAEPEIARMASSSVNYHRSWAQQQRAVDDAMQRGQGKLTYDIQSFQLSPDGVPVHFVRAEWRVRGQQGFAASLWLRGRQSLEVVETNLRPASWLRMFEFQGSVAREQIGLVLNVFDRNQDGWGEVLMAQGGYESMTLSLVEYSATGFRPTGIEYSYGC